MTTVLHLNHFLALQVYQYPFQEKKTSTAGSIN